MALVQYTAIVNQLRGKLNGSVFNKARTAFTLQSKQIPRKASTEAQTGTRSRFGQVQRSWKTLTQSQKNDAALIAADHAVRNRLGELVYLSGYNWYIRTNLFRQSIGLPILQGLDPDSVATYVFSNVALSQFSITQVGSNQLLTYQFRADVDVNSVIGMRFSLYISDPVSPGITVFYGNYLHVAAGDIEGNFGAGNTFIFFDQFNLPITAAQYRNGNTVWVKILFYTPDSGVTYQEYIFQKVLS